MNANAPMKWWIVPNSEPFQTRTLFKCQWPIQQSAQINSQTLKPSANNASGKWLFCSAGSVFCYLSCQFWSHSANFYGAEYFGEWVDYFYVIHFVNEWDNFWSYKVLVSSKLIHSMNLEHLLVFSFFMNDFTFYSTDLRKWKINTIHSYFLCFHS